MKTKINVEGIINIKKYDLLGNLIEENEFHNLITDVGIDYFRRVVSSSSYGPINKIGLGSSNIAATSGDTALKNRLILLDVNGKDYTISNYSVTYLATVPANSFSSTVYYQEGGLIYKSSTTELLITRVVFDKIVYQIPDNSLSISYTLNFSEV